MAISNNESSRKAGKRMSVKDQSGAGKIKLGELLSKAGQITTTQLETAKKIVKKGARMSLVLRQLEYIDEDTVFNFLSRQHNYPPVVIKDEPPSSVAISLIPYEIAKEYFAFPLRVAGNTLQITMVEPCDTAAVESLQAAAGGKDLAVCVSTDKDIVEAYKKYYKIGSEEALELLGVVEVEEEEELAVTEFDDFGSIVAEAADDFEIDTGDEDDDFESYNASDAPIIKLVNGILVKAVQDGVSDIHVEPYEKNMQVRYRKDGSLFKAMNLPLTIKNALVARVKILAGLDITERRIPQDGRIKMKLGRNRSVDFRVSSLPTLFGESVVLRILDKNSLNVDLTKLGFEVETFEALKRCLNRPQGLLLVTGPTGSGKTVTLYSALNSLNSEDIKILTAEDPVEFNFRGINQVNVNADVGMTFAAALKAFLRQDPDIIMVGEIRDMSTAEVAIKAAMTGHLVFSTLHTNDSAATIGRLIDIGIPPFMVASSVSMVLAQRLGRRLCNACKKVKKYPDSELLLAGFKKEELADLEIYGTVGCPKCNGLGYKGRVGFFELMEVTEEVSKAISATLPEDQLRKVAVKEGMVPLREAALKMVRAGVTSLEEAIKRTVAQKDTLPQYLVNPDTELYEDGEIIVRQGNNDKDFFKLIRGALNVIRGGKKIAEITEPGEYFGEMASIINEERTATITSQGRCEVKRYPGDKIDEILENQPEISRFLFNSVTSRLKKSNHLVVKLADSNKSSKAPKA